MMAKAVVHIHSDWSYDGDWSLPKIASFFGRMGYSLILTSEHDCTFDNERWEAYRRVCREASTDNTLIIPGLEYSDESNTIHVLVWGVLPFLGKNQMTGDLLQSVNDLKGICVLAHPSRRDAWQNLAPSWLPLFHGIEQWNRKFDGVAPSREAIALLNVNNTSQPFVGLDFHRANQLFPLSMMIRINDTLSEKSVIDALLNRQCYSLAFGISETWFRNGALAVFSRNLERIRSLISKKSSVSLMHKQ